MPDIEVETDDPSVCFLYDTRTGIETNIGWFTNIATEPLRSGKEHLLLGTDVFTGDVSVLQQNKLYNNTNGMGMTKSYSGALPIKNIKIRYNKIASNKNGGMFVQSGPSQDVYIYGNLIYNNGTYGLIYSSNLSGTMSHHVLNNTFYLNRRNEIRINRSNAEFKTLDIRNNILSSASNTIGLSDLKNAITEHSNNLFHYASNSGNAVTIAGKSYRTSDIRKWESSAEIVQATSHSVFANVSKDDYSLTEGSPAIRKGTDLSSIFKGGLNSKSAWPKNVETSEWSPGKWDIGAYVYGESSPAVNLLPPVNLQILSN